MYPRETNYHICLLRTIIGGQEKKILNAMLENEENLTFCYIGIRESILSWNPISKSGKISTKNVYSTIAAQLMKSIEELSLDSLENTVPKRPLL